MPRPRPRPLTPLAKEVQTRAAIGPKDPARRDLAHAMKLLPVVDLGGDDIDAQLAALEVLLRRAVGLIHAGGVSADHLQDENYERRAEVAAIMLQLDPRTARLSLTERRRHICRNVLTASVDGFRQGYELDTYELVADGLRLLSQEHAARTGRSYEPADYGPRLVTQQALVNVVVPAAALAVTLRSLLVISQLFRALPPVTELQLPGEAEVLRALESEDMELDYPEVWSFLRMQGHAEHASSLYLQSFRAFSWLCDCADHSLGLLETWEGAGTEVASEAAELLNRIISKSPFADQVDLSRLRIAGRGGEPAPFMDFIQTERGAELLSAWVTWIEGCDCQKRSLEDGLEDSASHAELDLTDAEVHGGDSACWPCSVRNAASGLGFLVDMDAVPLAVLRDLHAATAPPSPLRELELGWKQALYFGEQSADDDEWPKR